MAVELLAATQSQEAGLVEAPSMFEHEDTWFLFYSANKWDAAAYAIGYATCVGPHRAVHQAPRGTLAGGERSRRVSCRSRAVHRRR